MKKVLITGAAGFIGYHLALALKKQNQYVIGLDNFNDYYSVTLKKHREKNLLKEGVSIFSCDIQNKSQVRSLIDTNNITHVVHFAAQAGVRHSFSSPYAYIDANIHGFISLLEVLKEHRHIKLVFASSSSVYGLNHQIPFAETDITDRPTNLYGATKKAGEVLAFSYHHLYKIPMIGLRFFTVYGPWGRPDMAYFHFTDCILNNKPISVFNYGNMERDFTYVDDIIQGTMQALDLEKNFGIYNLGNSQAVSVLEMIRILEILLGKKAKKNMLPFQSGEMRKTFADISKSKKYLGYNPSTSLEDGLQNFVHWFELYTRKRATKS